MLPEADCTISKNTTWLQKLNSLIFAAVNKKRTILLQQIFAGFFLALFLFVHIIKFTHTHTIVPAAEKGYSKSNKASGSGNCSICDYQVAKDVHHFHDFYFVTVPAKRLFTYASHHTPFVTSVGATSSGRGPPSFS